MMPSVISWIVPEQQDDHRERGPPLHYLVFHELNHDEARGYKSIADWSREPI